MLVAQNVTSRSAVCDCGIHVTSFDLKTAGGTQDTCCLQMAVKTGTSIKLTVMGDRCCQPLDLVFSNLLSFCFRKLEGGVETLSEMQYT